MARHDPNSTLLKLRFSCLGQKLCEKLIAFRNAIRVLTVHQTVHQAAERREHYFGGFHRPLLSSRLFTGLGQNAPPPWGGVLYWKRQSLVKELHKHFKLTTAISMAYYASAVNFLLPVLYY